MTTMAATASRANRGFVLLYGVLNYVVFLGVFLYAIGFVGGVAVPKTLNSGPAAPLGEALGVNIALLLLFGLSHSIMARPRFKQRWTQIVPEPIERATYVLVSNVVLILLFWQWRPMPEIVWATEGAVATALWALFAAGFGLVLVSTWLIDHFDLFGLRQVVLYFRGIEYTSPVFQERSFYKVVRHPLMLGWLIAFWAAPVMTQGHLLFSAVTTLYIVAAIQVEERDLRAEHGDAYRDYRRRVSMLLPLPRRRS